MLKVSVLSPCPPDSICKAALILPVFSALSLTPINAFLLFSYVLAILSQALEKNLLKSHSPVSFLPLPHSPFGHPFLVKYYLFQPTNPHGEFKNDSCVSNSY